MADYTAAVADEVLDARRRLARRSIIEARVLADTPALVDARRPFGELAARLGIGSSSASEVADRLVELGLLRRHTEPEDRRQVVVTTTPEAEALLERFRELNQRQLRELLSQLDSDELDVVDRSLEILIRAIDRINVAPTDDHGGTQS